MSEQAAGYSVTFTNRRALKSAIQTEIKRLSKTDSTNYAGPDPSLVRALVDDAGWQQSQVADLLRVNVSTVRRWTANREQSQSREIPYAAWVVLLQAGGHTAIKSLAA